MNILVTHRESIEAGIVVSTPYVVISIRDARSRKPKVRKQAGLVDVLHLSFDDAEPSSNMELPRHIKLMTSDDATAIWNFVGRHRNAVGTIVVHCEQGMSRSPAVAAALAGSLGLDGARFWSEHQPNRFVYDLVLKMYSGAPSPGRGQVAAPRSAQRAKRSISPRKVVLP